MFTFLTECFLFWKLHVACEFELRLLIPDTLSILRPVDNADPVTVWDIVDPSYNRGRFVVFIEWLWRQEGAFGKFARLRAEREVSFQEGLNLFHHDQEENRA